MPVRSDLRSTGSRRAAFLAINAKDQAPSFSSSYYYYAVVGYTPSMMYYIKD